MHGERRARAVRSFSYDAGAREWSKKNNSKSRGDDLSLKHPGGSSVTVHRSTVDYCPVTGEDTW